MQIEYGEKSIKKEISMFFVGNNRYEFKGIDFLRNKISFQADNLLIGLVPHLSRTRLFLLAVLPWFGKLNTLNLLDIIGLARIKIIPEKHVIKVGIDGEIVEMNDQLLIESVPRALKALVPNIKN